MMAEEDILLIAFNLWHDGGEILAEAGVT